MPEKKSKKWKIVMILLICIVVLFAGTLGTLYYFDMQRHKENVKSALKELPVSEIPALLADTEKLDENKIDFSTDREFKENLTKFTAKTYKNLTKDVRADYSVLYDMTTDEILFEENGDKKCYPASTTKLLTAAVAAKIITDSNRIITVGEEIYMVGAESSRAGLKIGMQLTFSDLMDALMLPSGNDAANVMAVNCARIYKDNPKMPYKEALEVFVELMNEAAEQIGATNSHFVHPDGWHDENHYTTARDLAKIAVYAKSFPIIAKSCSTHYAERKLVKGGMMYWVNGNLMLNDYYQCYSQYCDGLKTGFTDQAGSCVVSSATLEGHTLIAVIMNGYDGYAKYDDANLLFTRGYRLYNLVYKYSAINQSGRPQTIQ